MIRYALYDIAIDGRRQEQCARVSASVDEAGVVRVKMVSAVPATTGIEFDPRKYHGTELRPIVCVTDGIDGCILSLKMRVVSYAFDGAANEESSVTTVFSP